jgi:hypothetical protein
MIDRDRLSKLLGMLGSDHDGEVINAARAADRLVRDAGLRWPDIAMPAPPRDRGDNDPVGFCLARPGVLTDWEERFLRSIARQPYRLTPKQCAVLGGIVSKVHAAGGRG